MRIKTIIVIILVIAAFGAGIYFKDDVIKFYNSFNKQVQNFQKTDVGQTISEVGKEILTPPPLNIGGTKNAVILLKSKVIDETNSQREANGLQALTENQNLDQAAAAKANDMFKNQYFDHVSPTGVDPGKLAQSFGYDYIVEGENLILGNFKSEKEMVQDWMNSPGHRANILNTRYVEMGASVVKGTYKGETVWIGVQEFGLPLSTCSQPSSSLKDEIDSDKSQLDQMASNIDQKKSEINNTKQRSAIYRQMIDDYNQLVVQYNFLANQLKQIISQYNQQVNDFNNCVAGK